jgi:hypothetical protein
LALTLRKSSTSQSGRCAFNFSNVAPPVATASILSPMTRISSPRNVWLTNRLPRSNGDLVPVFVVVRKRAGLKFFPKIEMAQLYFRAEADVASQGRLRKLGKRLG